MTTRSAHDRIVEATLTLVERDGLRRLNVARVAAEAGVTRQTVYTRFGSLAELVSQAMTGVAVEELELVTAELAARDDVESALDLVVELVVAVRRRFRERPLWTAVLRSSDDNPVLAPDTMARAHAVADAFLGPVFAREPAWAAAAELVREVVVRVGLSVVLFDSEATASDAQLRRLLRLWLGPSLEAVSAVTSD